MSEYLCVGGPCDGQTVEVADGVSVIRTPYSGDMEYIKTRPTDTNWRDTYNPDWWIMGEPEPVPPSKVFEWHEKGWMSPEVRAIREAVQEAADRFA